MDWIELLVRWLHVVAGIAWIGSSFYFIFLDASLRKHAGMPEGLAGESWQVHGGGFYRMRKYLVAPGDLPDGLHWFKWEAYTTWLSGFALLALIYYLGAEIFLIDKSVMDLSALEAVALGTGSLVAGWVIYDQLCKSPLRNNDAMLAGIGFALLVVAAWGYAHVFSGRAAYIHTGALIGTLMVGNVFFVIIPNQKKIVADLLAGRSPDPRLGARSKQRSLHNNYLTLPVLFVMLSSHYPMTFGSHWNWVILAGIFVAGGVVRHFFNMKHAGRGKKWWPWAVAAVVMAGVIALTNHQTPPSDQVAASFSEVKSIIRERCAVCHAARPTFDGFDAPPLGVVLETAGDIEREAKRIYAQSVATKAMPLGNITEMTETERAALAAWFAAGSPLHDSPQEQP
ncbi:MAG: urate hydroxylase PuuD [Sphingomonadales bacterium]